MRSLTIAGAALLAAGCGVPTVDVPAGNATTSDAGPSDIPVPSVQKVPERYPFVRLALRGVAPNAIRVLVEGAGNPVAQTVQPADGTFCVVVEVPAAPAHYVLQVKSQAGDGRLSAATTVELDRANDAPTPADAKLCDGSSPAS